ncbi:hydrogenase maturation nickel metallochaperone HypA [Halomonas rhizosphaerae]|uniref:Hydrogenase maturation factor HypA n=1 Tax=Halomonas rhizosphaerae TaxID=3043296 RepID=A0ABT6UZX2_9GAMM|nr:hydrogenase maturation nickel metallochaperone HypA [Halomonas rhizosphaerae]MDI5891486.1 hydrogenase maturation nickel metallochaperone HypA [Halomonas rhizosphaerae]MDI5919799.1 hydrogenase maturation nickel metallochaperone HypA [Halomonas rhizosphaerae]
MHELSLCRSLVRQASRVAAEHGALRIRRVSLRIGPLSGVEAALMREAFPLASRHTAAEGARLEMASCPVRVHCPRCRQEAEASVNDLSCPRCGHWQTRLTGGDELLLVSVDLADTSLPPTA